VDKDGKMTKDSSKSSNNSNRIFKKTKFLALVGVLGFSFALLGLTGNASAKVGDNCSDTLDRNALFGIPPWYKYLPGEIVIQQTLDGSGGLEEVEVCQPVIKKDASSEKAIPKKAILLIVAAVLQMLISVAGLAALGYLIYGGFMYLTSNGNAEQVKNAGSTMLNAIVGLAIAISATTLVNYLATNLSS